MTSWRPGCPVPLDDLRLVTVSIWGFDRNLHLGTIVVHRDVAADVVEVFRRLFRARFPIRRMEPVEAFGADDDLVMAANDTSGFNCRAATGQPGVWSEHSYGRAIDVNPVQNPYVDGATVLPPAGRAFLERSVRTAGMIHEGDPVVRAFAAVGWSWGGDYHSLKDYQHFSLTGR
jgi:D-alanyl-D-alanine carboxypeptidase